MVAKKRTLLSVYYIPCENKYLVYKVGFRVSVHLQRNLRRSESGEQ